MCVKVNICYVYVTKLLCVRYLSTYILLHDMSNHEVLLNGCGRGEGGNVIISSLVFVYIFIHGGIFLLLVSCVSTCLLKTFIYKHKTCKKMHTTHLCVYLYFC